MRDLIACLWIWLGPGIARTLRTTHRRLSKRGRRPAPSTLPTSAIPTAPPYARRPRPAHVRARLLPIDGHAFHLRPYVPPYVPVVHRG